MKTQTTSRTMRNGLFRTILRRWDVAYSAPICKATAVVLLLVSFLGAVIILCAAVGLRFNLTNSLPGVVYVTTSDTSSPLIEFCPYGPFAQLSRERGYRSRGICQDGAAPMLKPVVADAGDLVEVSALGITVNGRLLPNTAPRSTDSLGRPLAHFPFGKYSVPPGFVWVASQYNPRSFDSRYYGPISIACIRYHLRPL
jgi:conjugative transfer signal peptidase TraF